MKLKVGDIMMCKDSFSYDEGEHRFTFKQYTYYLITDIYNYFKSGDNSEYVQVYDDDGGAHCNLRIETYKKYFFTKRELRKKKLEIISLL